MFKLGMVFHGPCRGCLFSFFLSPLSCPSYHSIEYGMWCHLAVEPVCLRIKVKESKAG